MKYFSYYNFLLNDCIRTLEEIAEFCRAHASYNVGYRFAMSKIEAGKLQEFKEKLNYALSLFVVCLTAIYSIIVSKLFIQVETQVNLVLQQHTAQQAAGRNLSIR